MRRMNAKWKRALVILLTATMLLQNSIVINAGEASTESGIMTVSNPDEAEQARLQSEQESNAQSESNRIAEEERLQSEAESNRIAAEQSEAARLQSEQESNAQSESNRIAEEQKLQSEAESNAQSEIESENAKKQSEAESENARKQSEAESENARKQSEAESENVRKQSEAESENARKQSESESQAAEQAKAESEAESSRQSEAESQAAADAQNHETEQLTPNETQPDTENETAAETEKATEKVTYRVQFGAMADEHGLIRVKDENGVEQDITIENYYKEVETDSTFVFKVLPDEGYKVDHVKVEDLEVPKTENEAKNEYKVEHILKNIEINVSYQEISDETELESETTEQEFTVDFQESVLEVGAEAYLNGTEGTDHSWLALEGGPVEVLDDSTGALGHIRAVAEGTAFVSHSYKLEDNTSHEETFTVKVTAAESKEQTFTCAGDGGVTVTASVKAGSGIPEDAVLHADKLVGSAYDEAVASVRAQLNLSDDQVLYYVPYDVYFLGADGTRYEPNGSVEVSMKFASDPFADAYADDSGIQTIGAAPTDSQTGEAPEISEQFIAHIQDDGVVEKIAPDSASDSEFTFDVSSFSPMGPARIGNFSSGEPAPISLLDKGTLKVTKIVTGNGRGNKYKEWDFDIELKTTTFEIPVYGEWGGLSFKNGHAEFTLGDGDFMTITNLPLGWHYTVTEKKANEGEYKTSSPSKSGTIGRNTEIEFINHKENPMSAGNLTVSKTVKGKGDKTKDWHFIVTLSDKSINGRYGNDTDYMDFLDGVAKFTLKSGESKRAEGLPHGIDYTVSEEEENTDGYKTDVSDNGGGTIPENGDVIVEFINHKIEPATLTFSVKKTLTGRDLQDGEFEFELVETNKDGVPIGDVLEKTNAAGGNINFGDITYTKEGIYYYRVSETTGSRSGITYDTTAYRVEVNVTEENGRLVASPKYYKNYNEAVTSGDLTFTNTYKDETSIQLKATKTLTGRALDAHQFNFTLTQTDKNWDMLTGEGQAYSTHTSNTTEATNNVIFGEIIYNQDALVDEDGKYVTSKNFYYIIKEDGPAAAGYTYDKTEYHVTVTVSINETTGKLEATAAYATAEGVSTETMTFTNTYNAKGWGKVSGTKTLNGRELKAGEFVFEVKNEAGDVVGTATNDANGNFTVEGIGKELDKDHDLLPFTEEDAGKTYNFTLTEKNDSQSGITYDENIYGLKISVIDNDNGTLKVNVSPATDGGESSGNFTFTNDYDTSATKGLEVTKKLVGRALKADEFRFTLEANDPAYAHTVKGESGMITVRNDEEGKADFGTDAVKITLADMVDAKETKEGSGICTKEFGYTLMEQPTTQPAGDSSIVNDSNWLRRLTLEATYNKNNGVLTLEWAEGSEEQTFTNTYNTRVTTGTEVTKELVGLSMTGADVFTFKLEGADDAAKKTVRKGEAHNDPTTGKVSFADAIEITLDDLKVNEDNDANSYQDKEFTYRVSEVNPGKPDDPMQYDKHIYEFRVKAHYDFGTGKLTLEKTSETGNTTFTNTWTATTSVPLLGFKTQKDLNLTAGKYSFKVYNAADVEETDGIVTVSGEPKLSAENKANGSIDFGSLEYSLEDIVRPDGSYPSTKIFEYKVLEEKGIDKGVIYDTDVKTVRVKVTYSMETGELSAALVDGTELLAFVNEYDTEAEIGFNAAKRMNGRALTADDVEAYTFTLAADDEAYTGTVHTTQAKMKDTSGEITGFEGNAIRVTLDDMADVLEGPGKDGIYTKEFKYTLTETGSQTGVANDTTPKHLTVTATYNKNSGELKLTLMRWDNLTFVNTYDTSATKGLEVTKKLVGRALKADEFRFTLEANDPAYAHTVKGESGMITVKNDADGKVDFGTDAVKITLADMVDAKETKEGSGICTKEFGYTLMEQPTTQPAGDSSIVNDSNWLRRLTLEATYNKNNGVLTLEWADGSDNQMFTNTYTTSKFIGLNATKAMEGRALTADDEGKFTFTLTADDTANEKTVTNGVATNGPDGAIILNDAVEITLDDMASVMIEKAEDGIYTKQFQYTLTESGEVDGVTNSEPKHLTLNAEYNENTGELTLAWADELKDMSSGNLSVTFTNTYHAEGLGKVSGKKVLNGRKLNDHEFTFAVKNEDGETVGFAQNVGGSFEITGIGRDVDEGGLNVLPFTEADAGKTFTGFTLSEIKGGLPGVTYDGNEYGLTITVADNGDGTLNVDVKVDEGEAVFTNTYTTQKTITLSAAKAMEGRALTADDEGKFTFTLKADDTANEKTVTNGVATNGPDGAIILNDAVEITLDDMASVMTEKAEDGIYRKQFQYTLTETGEVDGVTNSEPKSLTLNAEYNENTGELTLAWAEGSNNQTFTNTYHAEGLGKVSGKKVLNGRKLNDHEFTFAVKNEDGETVGFAQNVGGSFEITGIGKDVDEGGLNVLPFTEEDAGQTFTGFTLSEIKGGLSGVTYDENEYGLTIAVTDNGDGTLNVDVTVNEGEAVFTNTYTTQKTITLSAMKAMEGRALTADDEGKFTFTLTADDTANEKTVTNGVATNGPDGAIILNDAVEITLDDMASVMAEKAEDGIYTKQFQYTLTETGEVDGVTNSEPKHLTLNAEYNENTGELTLAWVEGSDNQTFTNTYHAEGLGKVSGTKTLNGRKLNDHEFTFEVKNAEGETVGFAQNVGGSFEITGIGKDVDEGGLNVLPFTEKDAGQTFTGFTLSEIKGGLSGVTYDENEYGLTIAVTDNGDGTLNVDVTVNEGEAVFTNTYTTQKTITLSAVKAMEGRALTADDEGKFTFTLAADDTANEKTVTNGVATNGPDGAIILNDAVEITLDDMASVMAEKAEDGIYTKQFQYTLTESGEVDGVTNSEPKHLTLNAEYNENTGELTLTWAEGSDNQTFTNTYKATGLGEVSGRKVLNGRALQANEFTFEVRNAAGQVVGIATNGADGSFTITNIGRELDAAGNVISFTEEDADKSFAFTLAETAGSLSGVTYSTQSYPLTAKVTDNGDGTLNVVFTHENGEPLEDGELTFINTFAGSVTLTKTSTDGVLLPGAVFQLYAQNTAGEWNVYTGTNTTGSYTTDVNGTLTVPGLPAGNYYFAETQAPAGFIADPEARYEFTISPENTSATAGVDVSLTVTNQPEPQDGQLVVTKELTSNGETWAAENATFYVALYSDAALTDRVSEIQAIEFRNASASSVTFTGLTNGQTYYVAEVDAAGNVLNNAGGVTAGEDVFTVNFMNGNEVTIAEGEGTRTVYFRNEFQTVPEDYYREGELTVTKSLLGPDGAAKNSDETFYAGIFEDEAFTTLSDQVSPNVVPLDLNGGSSAGSTVKVSIAPDSAQTLYVTETDENGKPVDGAALFRYAVNVENGTVTLDEKNTTATVAITNIEDEEKYYREGELTITKRLLDADGNPKNSSETFYAGIFADANHTTLSDQVSQNIVPLSMGGQSSVSVTVKAAINPDSVQTLYVTEVDANGIPVANAASFRYEVTVEGAVITMDEKTTTASATITNKESSPESETEPTNTKSVKTGDETPILPFAIAFVAAAAVLLILGFRRRRRTEKH